MAPLTVLPITWVETVEWLKLLSIPVLVAGIGKQYGRYDARIGHRARANWFQNTSAGSTSLYGTINK